MTVPQRISSLATRRVWLISGLQGNNRRQRIEQKLLAAGAHEVRWISGEKVKTAAFAPNDVVVFHSGVNSHRFQGPCRDRARQVGASFVIDYALKPETIMGGGDTTPFAGVTRVPTGNQHLEDAPVPEAELTPASVVPAPTAEPAPVSWLEAARAKLDAELLAFAKANPKATATEIGRQFGVNPNTVSARLKPLGVDFVARRRVEKPAAKAAAPAVVGADLEYVVELLGELDAKITRILRHLNLEG